MTNVRFRLRRPDGVSEAGALIKTGCLNLTPSRRFDTDDGEVLPVPFQVVLRGTTQVVSLEPNGSGWCWGIEEVIPALPNQYRFVMVPATDATVDYEDLIDVDPHSLTVPLQPAGREYATTIGDGIHTAFTVAHTLASVDIRIDVFHLTNGQTAWPVVQRVDPGTLYIDFGNTVPAANSYRVLMTKVA